MKKQLFLFLIIAATFFSCNTESPIFSKKITYEEALEIQAIKFTLEGKTYESDAVADQAYDPFFCHEWPGECGIGKTVFYKSFGIIINESADKQIWLTLTPGAIVKEDLIEFPNQIYYDTRPTFKEDDNLGKLFVAEGPWISGDRNVKVKFTRGNPDTDFYFDDILQSSDHFEVLEVQKIKDRENSYLISGVFNATIPDGRSWLPANEQADSQVITDGSFHLIVEPLEEK
ncbi:MAG: hypothetical protein R3B93_11960 [Bacteroidia bacterium]